MLENAWQKRAARVRRQKRQMEAAGWEFVGEGGGSLWTLNRGYRIGYEIVEAEISACGTGVWVRIEDKHPLVKSAVQPAKTATE